MSDRIMLGIRWHKEVKQAEADAWKLVKLTGFNSFGSTSEQWIETFGDTEQDLAEYQASLARRYHRIRWWNRKARREILMRYISVHAILTVAHGLETVWR